MRHLDAAVSEIEQELITFTQDLVRIRSYTGEEEEVIRFIKERMEQLGFEEIRIDSMGNLLGRIGNGPVTLLFDSHVDTVEVNDAEQWSVPPFSGAIRDGRLYGRGSVDMKSSVAATLYGAVLAHRLGWGEGVTVLVSCTVMEEDCDGENLRHLFEEFELRPDYVVICEPSDNVITLGHKGKAQIVIRTRGVAAHGSAPEKGRNAVYEMAEITRRVETTNANLADAGKPGSSRGTLVLSRISSTAESLNAVPYDCEIYLDRRTVPGETNETVQKEMERIVAGKEAEWAPGTLKRRSWTGLSVVYEPMHPPWRIAEDAPLTRACAAAHRAALGSEPERYEFWDFSTNAVTPVALGIPTIGFGPGEYKLAHTRDESCRVDRIVEACSFYAHLVRVLADTSDTSDTSDTLNTR